MAKKKPQNPRTVARSKAIKEAGGKRALNSVKKQVKNYTAKDFAEIAPKLTNFGRDKLLKIEITNYLRREDRKIKKLRAQYQDIQKELKGASMKDASPEIKKQVNKILEEQLKINTSNRPIKEAIKKRDKHLLTIEGKIPASLEITGYRAWERDKFEKEILSNPYIHSINGFDKKTQLDKIIDSINGVFSKMDSTKVFAYDEEKDGEINTYYLDEHDADEIENSAGDEYLDEL